ncbi:hypothetical protein A5645_00805 [Mycobacterium asiaticum]|uniref:hypothetical protein n=1 Tax=Mycobacterium asiaticum TaxID=1790 RepID=UPI0007EFD0BF|nr:hypothetical protein [Mycobacterium asiaticum]OBK97061.1 hypothetical protein A5645_00805 [Mycobacterium asiaticum]
MVTPTFDISGHPANRARRTSVDGEVLRHRLDVFAARPDDVVQTAGGWLFDRVMAGWQVNVMLPGGGDDRSLRILGVQVLDLESELDLSAPLSQSLAVSGEAFIAHGCLREKMRKAMGNRLVEVALWGQGWPLGTDRSLVRTEYQLSAAARAFKGQALRAAGIAYQSIDPSETLFTDSAWLG